MPRLPSSSVWSPGRISSIREHGSQTIVISNSAPPTRNRWPTGHVRTSSPSIVKFSRMRPYSRPSASRCSAEANSTCRLVPGRACAHPSRPCSSSAWTRSRASIRPLPLAGEVHKPARCAITLTLPGAPDRQYMSALPVGAQTSAPLVQCERAGDGDVQRLRARFEPNRCAFVTLGEDPLGEPFSLRAEHKGRSIAGIQLVERLSAVRDECDAPTGSLLELSRRDAEDRARRCPERLGPRRICATYGQRDERRPESIRRSN